jgi:hypothetical protein
MNEQRKTVFFLYHLICLAVVSCALLLNSLSVPAQTRPQSFSADQIQTLDGKTTTFKVYATDKAVRREGEVEGKRSVWITRFDHRVMWVLEPDDNTYSVVRPVWDPLKPGMSFDKPSAYMSFYGLTPGFTEFAHNFAGAKVERESLGLEEVGPYHCDKLRFRVSFERDVYISIEWAAKELGGLVVKGQDEKGERSTEYQNIRPGPQDPSQFEIPKGYKKSNEYWAELSSRIKKSK